MLEYTQLSGTLNSEMKVSKRTEELLKMMFDFKRPNHNRFNSGLFLNSIKFPCMGCSNSYEMANWIYELHDKGYIHMFGRTFEDAEFTLKGMEVIDNLGKKTEDKIATEKIIFVQNTSEHSEDIIEIKPNIFGFGINVNALWKRIKKNF